MLNRKIASPYTPDLDSTMTSIFNFIQKVKAPEILIVGANASALELIYQITNDTEKNKQAIQVVTDRVQRLEEKVEESITMKDVLKHNNDIKFTKNKISIITIRV